VKIRKWANKKQRYVKNIRVFIRTASMRYNEAVCKSFKVVGTYSSANYTFLS
jgi:hypothetical protein